MDTPRKRLAFEDDSALALNCSYASDSDSNAEEPTSPGALMARVLKGFGRETVALLSEVYDMVEQCTAASSQSDVVAEVSRALSSRTPALTQAGSLYLVLNVLNTALFRKSNKVGTKSLEAVVSALLQLAVQSENGNKAVLIEEALASEAACR
ncbi:hypothetical protein DIPPA_00419 [Diplonema papillatum]|nr:hypothetical protein DIPPA_00419 [Diplonema papillatum]